MPDPQTVLQLVLDDIGLGGIGTMQDRIAIQKAVYLLQDCGLSLGYGYSWYKRGPYSPALTADYYQIAGNKAAIQQQAAGFELTPSAKASADKVKQLIQAKPDGLALDLWLEALASYQFLFKFNKNRPATREKLNALKVHVSAYSEQAEAALANAELLN